MQLSYLSKSSDLRPRSSDLRSLAPKELRSSGSLDELSYLSRTPGTGGSLKDKPEDFIVEEIMNDGTVLEIDKSISKEGTGEFTHFVLQKKDWSTNDAIKKIAERLHTNFRRFNAAGTKDKNAITTQLVSVFGIAPDRLRGIDIKDIKINGAWPANEKLDMGDLIGNRFTIKINDAKEDATEIVNRIYAELNGVFPNYFGEQRFGSVRRNTHLVGEKIIKDELEDAALTYLTDCEGEGNEEARLARKELSDTLDFKAALKTFPRHLRLERMMLSHLASHPKEYANAFRELPRSILLMFIHAFQSHLFNISLSERIANGGLKPEKGEYFCGENAYGFLDLAKKADQGFLTIKLIGYETEPNERELALLEKFGITEGAFKIRSIPEISSKGTYRTALAPLKDFEFADGRFKFSLASGSYATVALREFIAQKNST